jgi:Secreted repeat of unknown function
VLRKRGKLRAGAGVSKDLLATTTRRNGDRQVTYNGHPLYYYVGDTRPKQVLCQDVQEFGGRWYVVEADGEPVLRAGDSAQNTLVGGIRGSGARNRRRYTGYSL